MTEKPYAGWSILVDCDGTLTNGQKHINSAGQRETISFHARDSVACKMLVEMGFQVIVLTHSGFPGIANYWNRYGASVFWAVKGDPLENKLNMYSHFVIDWNKTIGIGDDITDNCFLQKCKYPYIVADAHPFYQFDTDCMLCNGGGGVLAYIYEYVKQGKYD